MPSRSVGPFTLSLLGALAVWGAGCTCGADRERPAAHEEPTPSKVEEQTPPAEPAQPPPRTKTGARGDPRFGSASLQLLTAGEENRVHVSLVIPEGQTVEDGVVQPAAVYFDNGPPLRVSLTARGGRWDGGELRVPEVVKSAREAVLKIPLQPQITHRFDVTGAWERTTPDNPLTIESPR